MMRRVLLLTVLAATAAGLVSPASAATPPEQALTDGMKAFQAGQFEKARDLFLKATQTAKPAGEAFLWLGKAHFQLGDVEEAIAAWDRTLKIIPNEPHAARMLKALRGEIRDAETRITLVKRLLDARMIPYARRECAQLLADKTLTDAQRVAAMTLYARGSIDYAKGVETLALVVEIGTRFPKLADQAELTLLTAQAKVRTAGQEKLEGLALLADVITKYPKTSQAVTAEYELAAFEASSAGRDGSTDRLAKWIAANGKHRLVATARQTMMTELFRRSAALPAATAETKLRPLDTAALGWASKLYAQVATDAEATALTRALLSHVNKVYTARKAHAAASAAVVTLLQGDLPPASRGLAAGALLASETALTLDALARDLRTGKMGAAMPAWLAGLVKRCNDINGAALANTTAWRQQADIAARVKALAWTQPKTLDPEAAIVPYDWAVTIALPVVRDGTDATAVARALAVITEVRDGYQKLKAPAGLKRALAINTQLLAATAKQKATHAKVVWSHVAILDAYARWTFDTAVADGLGARNAALNAHQKALIDTLKQIVATDTAGQAAKARATLAAHLKPWLQAGHYAAVEEAYTLLAVALDAAQAREVQLDVATLWVRQALADHNRFLVAGLNVPAKIDPPLAQALKRCYDLQGSLEEGDAFLARVRALSDSVLNHYARLEYYAVVAGAIQIKGPKPAPAAERYAAMQLAIHREQAARRALTAVLARHGGKDTITLTPAFALAIKAYGDFIKANPTSKMVPQAVGRIRAIAGTFEQHGAYDVAVKIYTDFAAMAAGQPVLAASGPGRTSVVETITFASASALDAKARKALTDAQAEQKGKKVPPAKISPEFAAALAAYEAFITARPDGPLAGTALTRIMAVGTQYAQIDAWDVADSVYAGLLKRKLPLRKPERLEFSRGVCQLGKVMGDHARSVLAALAVAQRDKGRRYAPDGYMAYGGWESKGDKLVALNGVMVGGEAIGSAGFIYEDGKKTPGGSKAKPAPKPIRPATPDPAARPAGQSIVKYQKDLLDEADQGIAEGEMLAMVAIKREQSRRSVAIAQLQDQLSYRSIASNSRNSGKASQVQQRSRQSIVAPAPVLSEAELARQDAALAAAYAIFTNVRKTYPRSASAKQARGEIMIMIGHWRGIRKWQRAAALAATYLTDNADDIELPTLRLSIARDYLSWAAEPVTGDLARQAMLAEVTKRFTKARDELALIVKTFPKDVPLVQKAQWDIAGSFLAQARVVTAFSSTLARGQFVRAAKELQRIAGEYHDHPKIASIPQMLWDIASEQSSRAFYDEAMIVWNDLTIHYPTHALAGQAAMQIARTYETTLRRPLLAVEVYQEICFARGGTDTAIQTAIYNIGVRLQREKRWVEALHVLSTFVDSFPTHVNAGQALTTVGQIHQTNQAWDDAIAAYRRVINEFPTGTWVREARWAIAECRINLSQWSEATLAYRAYQASYAKDARTAETTRRLSVLKDLSRYQSLVNEKGQRKADDAQNQIATIVQTKLANPTKAIIEFRKVTAKWPTSHLADDALFAVGTTYLAMGETALAREALLALASKYADSPLADDALYKVGQSYEGEAQALASVTRGKSLEKAQEIAQKKAYTQVQSRKREQRFDNSVRNEALRASGQANAADLNIARDAQFNVAFDQAEVQLAAQGAQQETETLTAAQLADRQDKINASLRMAVKTYKQASTVAQADKAGDALLRMAEIYHERLKDSPAALATWLEIVRQFSGTAVAEDASWRIAEYHERAGKFAEAIDAYNAFLRNYRRSAKAGAAQFAVAENYEDLGQWIKAMDSYTNYITNFPTGPMVQKAKDQIQWIKTYRL